MRFNHWQKKNMVSFLYSADEFGNTEMRFWNDQLVVPPPEILTDD